MSVTESAAVSWRSLGPEDGKALGRLYDLTFTASPGTHFLDDFSVWNPALPVPDRRQWGAFIDTQLIAAAGSRVVKLHDVAVPALLIGGVAVHPDHQKKGLATEAIQRLIDEAKELEERVAVIWGSEKSLYARFGFQDAGVQKRAALSALPLRDLGNARDLKVQISQGLTYDLERDLQRSRQGGMLLDPAEIEIIRASKNIQWARAEMSGVSAYVGIGKGIDLPGIIHTWGGDARVLESLLFAVKTSVSENLEILWHPSHETKYSFFGGARAYEREVLAMVRVGGDVQVDVNALWFWGTDSA